MTTRAPKPTAWLSWLGVVMLMVSMLPILPASAAAQEIGPAESTITVNLRECDPGSVPDPAQLWNECGQDGLADVEVKWTATDPASGVAEQSKTTVRQNGAGAGIATSDPLPAGTYRVQVNLPADANQFAYHCVEAGTQNVVQFQVDPTQANVISVTLTDTASIECGVYVIPNAPAVAPPATFEFNFRTCERGDMPSDDRAFESLRDNCNDVPTEPVKVSVRDMNQASQPVEEKTLDATGKVQFTVGTGDYEVFSDLDMDTWGEYLFCEYEGQPRYEKDFVTNDRVRGVTTFSDMDGEQIRCDWFGVQAPDPDAAPSETTAPSETAAPSETVAPSETAVPSEPAARVQAPDTGVITVTTFACPEGFVPTSADDLQAFQTNCTAPVTDLSFTMVNGVTNIQTPAVSDANGVATFNEVAANPRTLWSTTPLEAADEYYFCGPSSGTERTPRTTDRGVLSLTAEENNSACQLFQVAKADRTQVTGSSVEVHLAICPPNYTGSNYYSDCHGNGAADLDFELTVNGTTQTGTTRIETTPGPGIVRFTGLPAGDYVLAGGPPQDFGKVFLYCSDPATNTQLTTQFENGVGGFTVAENQSVICDWYFLPEDASGITPTPVPEQRAEIFTTMFVCPPGVNPAGAKFSQLDSGCTQRLSNVPMTLQAPGGVPITVNTGESGEGAIRFYDLRAGNYVLTPKLPTEYVSAAVYCDLNGVDVYQKTLKNGSTEFVNVDGEKISCSWFVTAKPAAQQPQQGPTGSITLREMRCEGDRSSIKNWETECTPGATGASYTIRSVNGSTTQTLKPNDQGVVVFSGLPNEHYEVTQSEGIWCRATAEFVDSESRVIVQNGRNTDVFLYHCNQNLNLPATGTGATTAPGNELPASMVLSTLALPLFALAAWQVHRQRQGVTLPVEIATPRSLQEPRPNGYRYR